MKILSMSERFGKLFVRYEYRNKLYNLYFGKEEYPDLAALEKAIKGMMQDVEKIRNDMIGDYGEPHAIMVKGDRVTVMQKCGLRMITFTVGHTTDTYNDIIIKCKQLKKEREVERENKKVKNDHRIVRQWKEASGESR